MLSVYNIKNRKLEQHTAGSKEANEDNKFNGQDMVHYQVTIDYTTILYSVTTARRGSVWIPNNVSMHLPCSVLGFCCVAAFPGLLLCVYIEVL